MKLVLSFIWTFSITSLPLDYRYSIALGNMVVLLSLIHAHVPSFVTIRNDPCVEGGESTLLDGLEVVERLRETHPRQFEILSKVQVPFQKIRQKG